MRFEGFLPPDAALAVEVCRFASGWRSEGMSGPGPASFEAMQEYLDGIRIPRGSERRFRVLELAAEYDLTFRSERARMSAAKSK